MRALKYIVELFASIGAIFLCIVTIVSPTEIETRGIEYITTSLYVFRYELMLSILFFAIYKSINIRGSISYWISTLKAHNFEHKKELIYHTTLTVALLFLSAFLLFQLFEDVLHVQETKFQRVNQLDEYNTFSKFNKAIELKNENRYRESVSILNGIPESKYEDAGVTIYMREEMEDLLEYTDALLRPRHIESLSDPPFKRRTFIKAAEVLRVRPRLSPIRARLDSALTKIEGYRDLSDRFFAYCEGGSQSGLQKLSNRLWMIFEPTVIYDHTGTTLEKGLSSDEFKSVCKLVSKIDKDRFKKYVRNSWKLDEVKSIVESSKKISKE